jgi:uncharacterized protein YcfJ
MRSMILVFALLFAPSFAVLGAEFDDYAPVLRVSPVVEQVSRPRQECRQEYTQVPVQFSQENRSAGGAVLGGIAGAILGRQIGGGNGRMVATAAGAIVGTIVGDRIDNSPSASQYGSEQGGRHCRLVDIWETRTTGYDVTYEYHGNQYVSRMAYDPGQRLRLRVSAYPQ